MACHLTDNCLVRVKSNWVFIPPPSKNSPGWLSRTQNAGTKTSTQREALRPGRSVGSTCMGRR